MTQVVLLERVGRLGGIGDVVTVKPGFARNFLIPQKKALHATKANLAVFAAQKAQLEQDNINRRDAALTDARTLEGKIFILIRQAGEGGQLYGSVSAKDIADAISETGIAVNKAQVDMNLPVKALGLYQYTIALHPEVRVQVTLNVARTADEAAAQARGDKATREVPQAFGESSEATDAATAA